LKSPARTTRRLYTRAGSFNKNADGRLVTIDGYTVEPAIIVPEETIEVVINETGQVYAKVDGEIQPRELGQLSLPTLQMMSVSNRLVEISSGNAGLRGAGSRRSR
jgi:flagellar basal body rod protein FlgG